MSASSHYDSPPLPTDSSIVSTKFYDPSVVNSIFSYPDIVGFRRRSDWFKLMRINAPTWPSLVREFLASLTLLNIDDSWLGGFSIEFKLLGVRYRLPLSQLNEIYAIDRAECRTEYFEFDPTSFWRRITTAATYDNTSAHASEIQNPTLRYIHYVIANTIFGRSRAVQKVTPLDLFALWCLVVGNQANMLYFMFKYMEDVGRYGDTIVFGGVLTPIFECLGVNFDMHQAATGKRFLDFDELVELGMLSPRVEGGWYLHFASRCSIRLPDFDRIRLDVERNWHMADED